MNTSRRQILYSASGRVPWLIAAVLLVLLLAITVALSRAYERAEAREINRYFDSIAAHIENDLLKSAGQHAAIQSRMATRERLAQRSPAMNAVALEPLDADTSKPALVFMTPISANREVVNWLAAVMVVPDSIRAMLKGHQRDARTPSG